jgi:uncharacterized heparinase superfamily protein
MVFHSFSKIAERAKDILPFDIAHEDMPERLIVRPVDLLKGDAEAGQLLCKGVFTLDGRHLELHGECWEPVAVHQRWLDHLHAFRWLRDLRASGTASAKQQAQALIASWIHHYPKDTKLSRGLAWRADMIGERLALWICHHDFFAADAPDEFDDLFFESLMRQSRALVRYLNRLYDKNGGAYSFENAAGMARTGVGHIRAIKGMIYAGLALEGHESWIAQGLEYLRTELDEQILEDGSHISRSAFIAMQFLKAVLDIKVALSAGGHPLPNWLELAIERMVPAVRFHRYGDKKFGLFHGTLEGHVDFADSVLAQAGVRGRRLKSLPDGGFEKAIIGRTLLMFDCGGSPKYPHGSFAHAAPLAFEMAYGKDRVLVNCGTHIACDDWRDVLRGPAAHTAFALDGHADALGDDDHFKTSYRTLDVKREDGRAEGQDFCYMQAAHDLFVKETGLIHRRSLYLSQDGHDVRGEDRLEGKIAPVKPHVFSIRFHIHPRVLVSLIQDGKEALLRLPGGVGWRFQQVGGILRLEDSVYAGDFAEPRKTQQLVIYSQMGQSVDASVKWALRREGL